jgi:hypothetical protein
MECYVKGLSAIISTILILATLMFMLGAAGLFFTDTFTDVSKGAEETNRQLTDCRDKLLAVDSASWNGDRTEIRVRSRRGNFRNVSVVARPSLKTAFVEVGPGDYVDVQLPTPNKPDSIEVISQNCGISEQTEVSS